MWTVMLAFMSTVELIVSMYEPLNMDMAWQEGEGVRREGIPGQEAEREMEKREEGWTSLCHTNSDLC